MARYEAVLGRERRRYDLNQGSYLFEASSSIRTPPVEVMAVFQHVSRHTVDRENQPAVSWNTYGVRARREWVARAGSRWAGTRVEGEADIAKAMQQAFVDYRWVSQARAKVTVPVSSTLALIAEGTGDVVGVDEATRGGLACAAGASRGPSASRAGSPRSSCTPATSGASTRFRPIAIAFARSLPGFASATGRRSTADVDGDSRRATVDSSTWPEPVAVVCRRSP